MGFFDFLKKDKNKKGKKNKQANGIIGEFDLYDWWISSFNEEERQYIISEYPGLIKNRPDYEEPAKALLIAAGYFQTKKDADIANRIYNKAENLVDNKINLHFIYNGLIKTLYKKRNDDPKYLEQTIKICEKQINIANEVMQQMKKEHYERGKTDLDYQSGKKTLEEVNKDRPFTYSSHGGFKQLAIIKQKQGEYEKVIELCKEAKKQGWDGDWDKRIERAKNKL